MKLESDNGMTFEETRTILNDRFPAEGPWPSASHGKIPVTSMDDKHLVNSVISLHRMWEEQVERWKERLEGYAMTYLYPILPLMYDELRKRYVGGSRVISFAMRASYTLRAIVEPPMNQCHIFERSDGKPSVMTTLPDIVPTNILRRRGIGRLPVDRHIPGEFDL